MRTEVPNYEPDIQREDEDARQERWDTFVERARSAMDEHPDSRNFQARELLGCVVYAMTLSEPDPRCGSFINDCLNFAETEGWSSVVGAISHVLRERERFHRECFDRR